MGVVFIHTYIHWLELLFVLPCMFVCANEWSCMHVLCASVLTHQYSYNCSYGQEICC